MIGIVIGEEVGMRMKVAEWLSSWMCREEGVQFPMVGDDTSHVFVTHSSHDFDLSTAIRREEFETGSGRTIGDRE